MPEHIDLQAELASLLPDGDVLIVVPPFAYLDQPSLAAHVLQACAAEVGAHVRVLYANLLLSSVVGAENYTAICRPSRFAFWGERLFARSAHGLDPFGNDPMGRGDDSVGMGDERMEMFREHADRLGIPIQSIFPPLGLDESGLRRFEEIAASWMDAVAQAVAGLSFRIVGCTTSFEQTNASVALLRRVKARRPDVVTILGGANCEGETAEGMAALTPSIDYIFSGECELAFPRFLRGFASGALPAERIIRGEPCMDLDAVPEIDFTEYADQYSRYLSSPSASGGQKSIQDIPLPYESSRGCWWRQKHPCTFCGLNGERTGFRQKSADRVMADLRRIAQAHPGGKVEMVDNIMPFTYFRDLLPRLAAERLPLDIWYEQKANLSLARVLALKDAGVSVIYPGIEALSTALLRRMGKGVKARQNIMLLRNAGSAGLILFWTLLWGFPGDEAEAYEETLALLPLVRHLQPPVAFSHLRIVRFSPYFDHQDHYGIRNVRPNAAYASAFPPHADVQGVAQWFTGEYESGAYQKPDVILKIHQEVAEWRKCWAKGAHPPSLKVVRCGSMCGDGHLLVDTRGLPGTRGTQSLDPAQVAVALTARPYSDAEDIGWAIEQKLGVVVDSWYVPLATASPDLLMELGKQPSPCSR